jgi:hypothetical protein
MINLSEIPSQPRNNSANLTTHPEPKLFNLNNTSKLHVQSLHLEPVQSKMVKSPLSKRTVRSQKTLTKNARTFTAADHA